MKDELLVRLESFELDEPAAAFPFSARLARENGWSRSFARRVVAEYKRFVWLAMRAGHPVTPSEEVDEAWHLHLCYTRSYWDRMCGEILGKPLHHGPTEGGKKEDEKFAGWYARTLESYRSHFGEEPPADIWPPVGIRFLPATMRKVDAATHWILPKRTAKRVAFGTAVVAMLPVLGGCSSVVDAVGPMGLIFIMVVTVVVISRLILAAAKKWGKSGKGCGSGCGTISSCGGGGSSGCGSKGDSDSGSSDSGSSGCGSSGCSSSGCGGGGCGGGGD
jgi:hypothetical protein